MTQAAEILDHLKTAPLTPLQALNDFGCFRLAARIDELRSDGWPINTTIIKDQTTGKRFARYSMERKD